MSLSAKDAVAIQIEQEKHDLTERNAALEVQIRDATDKVAAASDARHKAWDKVEASIPKKERGKLDYADPKLIEAAEAADKTYHQADKTLDGLRAALAHNRKRLEVLENPDDEIERRAADKERLAYLRARTREQRKEQRDQMGHKPKVVVPKVTAKEQGFPDVYLGPTGNFVPGADATAKHDLVVAVLGIKEPVKHKFQKATAQKLLKVRGWEQFVEKRRKSEAQRIEREKKAKEAAKS